MHYTDLDAKLNGRCKLGRKLANNTYARREAKSIVIRLHATDIMEFFPNNSIMLNSGGWRTVTTKARMNDYLPGPWRITQARGQWYLTKAGNPWEEVCLFADGLVIAKDGTITGGLPLENKREALKLRGKIRSYALQYVDALRAGEVEKPGLGDCFYCGMRTVNGDQPLGEAFKDRTHLLSHMEEKYFVPSLIVRAMETMPSSPMMRWAVSAAFNNKADATYPDFVWPQIAKCLTKYLVRQLGQVS